MFINVNLTQSSFNPFLLVNWERIGKFAILNLAVSIIVASIIILIVNIFTDYDLVFITGLICITTLMGNMFLLSSYEQWRGCRVLEDTEYSK